MLTDNTKVVLNNLKRFGANPDLIKQLEAEIDSNKAVGNYFDKSTMRAKEFTEFVTQKEQETEQLRNQIKELATLHDVSTTSGLDENVKKQLLEKIVILEDALIETGQFEEDEVRKLSFKEKQFLTVDKSKEGEESAEEKARKILAQSKQKESEEEGDMPNQNGKKYIDEETFEDTFKTGMANLAMGSISVNNQMFRAIRRAEKLYGKEFDENLADTFENKVKEGLMAGKTVPQIAEEHFKYSEREEKIRNDETARKIEEAKLEGKREALKEFSSGVPRSRSSLNGRGTGAPVYNRKRFQTSQDSDKGNPDNDKGNREGQTKNYNGVEVPVNKFGDAEVFRARGNVNERVERASNFYSEVMEKVGEDGVRMGFGE